MVQKFCTALAIAALLSGSSAAHAVTITSRNDADVKVTVIEGDAKQDLLLPAGKVIEGICQKGCIVRLNDSDKDEYELLGSEAVSVEDGFMYYESPDGSGAPAKSGTVAPGNRKID